MSRPGATGSARSGGAHVPGSMTAELLELVDWLTEQQVMQMESTGVLWRPGQVVPAAHQGTVGEEEFPDRDRHPGRPARGILGAVRLGALTKQPARLPGLHVHVEPPQLLGIADDVDLADSTERR